MAFNQCSFRKDKPNAVNVRAGYNVKINTL